MKPLIWFLLMVALCTSTAMAETIGADHWPTPEMAEDDEILLKDGSLLKGTLVEEREDLIIFETVSLGRLEIPRVNIERMVLRDEIAGFISDPDQNSIMFCPTPATLPRGDAYFRDFELFVLNFGFGVTDNFDLSFGTLFPISSSVIMVSGGAKLRLVDREKSPVGLALTGSFTSLEETQFGSIGTVAGIGDSRRSLNLAINRTFDDDGDQETVYIVGGDFQISRSTKFFAEYFTSSSLLDEEDDDLNGFINIGFRFFGEDHSFSLSGFRPLLEDTGSFIAFPMIMYSRHW